MLSKKNFAFTLAEILITLGIIGVIAAMTIPNLMNNYKAYRLKTQFFKTYSTLKQISKLMQADEVTGDANEYPPLSRSSFQNTFKLYLKGATNCGNSARNCYPGEPVSTSYRRVSGTQYGGVTLRIGGEGSFILPDGSIIFISNGYPVGSPILIEVDINGYKTPPNAAGYDLFFFQLMDDAEILPMGMNNTQYIGAEEYCNPYKNKAYSLNGISCAAEAVKNPDYFKQLPWKFF